jgi:thiol-disulfide isomerase/thioredoxin
MQCLYCRKLKPIWQQLAEEWEDHEFVLVAEVDCTADEGRELCQEADVQGYPTLKYGNPTNLDTYEGSRSFQDLHIFTKENLKAPCSPKNPEQCSNETKQLFEEYTAMSLDELDAKLNALETQLTETKGQFVDQVAQLKDLYDRLTEEKETKLEAIKKSGLDYLKTIQKARKTSLGTTTDEL